MQVKVGRPETQNMQLLSAVLICIWHWDTRSILEVSTFQERTAILTMQNFHHIRLSRWVLASWADWRENHFYTMTVALAPADTFWLMQFPVNFWVFDLKHPERLVEEEMSSVPGWHSFSASSLVTTRSVWAKYSRTSVQSNRSSKKSCFFHESSITWVYCFG